jgi:glycosyltransferase involved in cell wall biosynthesis
VIQTVHDVGFVCPNLMLTYADTLKKCPGGIGLKCLKHGCLKNPAIYFSLKYFHKKRNRLIEKTIYRFIAPSLALKRVLENNGFKDITFLPNFVEKPKTKPSFKNVKKNQILYAGQLEKNKGVAVLLREFSIALKKNPNLILNIAGTGSQMVHLKTLCRELGIQDKVNFLGWVSNMDKPFQQSTCLILPSLCFENAPMVILEAMSRGRPVLGANRGGIPWFIENGKNGFVFEPLKKGELADLIVKITKNANLSKKMGKAAFVRFSKIDQKEQHIKKIIKIYKDSCGVA